MYNNILDIEGGIIPIYTNTLTESIFLSFKNLYSKIYNNKEAMYWKKHNFLTMIT